MYLFFFITFYLLATAIFFNKKNNFYLLITFFIFFLLSALRSTNVGNDTSDYKLLFDNLIYNPISQFTWRYESGYLYYNKIIQFFTYNSQILFVVSAAIICIGYGILIHEFSDIPWISVYLFFMLRYFDLSMNVLRQSLAMVILFFGFNILVKGIKGKYFFYFISVVVLASFFHGTALVFLMLIFSDRIKSEKRFIVFVSILTLICFFSFDIIFNIILKFFPAYFYYMNSSYMDGTTKLATVLNLLVNVVILLFIHFNGYEKNKENKIMFNALIIGISIMIVSFRFSLLDRMSDFFTVYSIILLPNSIYFSRYNSKLSLFFTYILIICFFIYYIVIIVYRPDWNRVYPYEFFWNYK
ncbi:EpsG family protein [Enterococcus camelliae]|uniref:EpsG family protein n=1 Tax=Enterococcus camelliae TaxID=453959 RepID=A0ABW5THY9_9ENTE